MISSVQEVLDIYELKNTSWQGAKYNLQKLIDIGNYDLQQEFLNYLNEYIDFCCSGSIDRTELNDLLWFEDQFFIDFYKLEYETKIISKEEYIKLLDYYGIEEE